MRIRNVAVGGIGAAAEEKVLQQENGEGRKMVQGRLGTTEKERRHARPPNSDPLKGYQEFSIWVECRAFRNYQEDNQLTKAEVETDKMVILLPIQRGKRVTRDRITIIELPRRQRVGRQTAAGDSL